MRRKNGKQLCILRHYFNMCLKRQLGKLQNTFTSQPIFETWTSKTQQIRHANHYNTQHNNMSLTDHILQHNTTWSLMYKMYDNITYSYIESCIHTHVTLLS